MNDLVNLVAEKTGIPADKARTAVETVLEFLKGKLPAPLASQLDSAVSGEGGEGGEASALAKGLGGLFGK